MEKSIEILLVTANVGSIFEDPSQMLKLWTQEFLSTVAKLDPKFIALHCQEVGGKNYEKSMKYVEDFVKLLMNSDELRLFDKIRVFIDEDYSSAENFTALGNIYFIHETVTDVLIWDFNELNFVKVEGQEINSGNIESVVTKEKSKFPQDFFPECKWSRKGFLRTRWSIFGTVFDLINIHLFHDASNFIAMETFPSVYSKNRRRALEHTLQRFHNDRNGIAPFFVFGDFNFRTDTEGVVKKLTEGLITTRVLNQKSKDYSKIQFHNEDSELILTIGKKEFNHNEHQDIFLKQDGSWLKLFDRELEEFNDQLYEFSVNFPPSYPFEENLSQANAYMLTRCPAWCDRILLSKTAKLLVNDEDNVKYDIIGKNTCMGDHKPVFLRLDLYKNAGTIKCCSHLVELPVDSLIACNCCKNYSKIEINVIDMSDYFKEKNSLNIVDSNYLHDPFTKDNLTHDPYTPESIDSHSPLPESEIVEKKLSVSPRILKSRLEHILRTETQENDQKTPFLTCKNVDSTQNLNYTTKNTNEIDKNLHETILNIQSDPKTLNLLNYDSKINENANISQEKKHPFLFHTQSDIPNRFLQQKQCRLLLKSQSQTLETDKYIQENFRKRCMTDISRKTSKAKLIGADRAQSITRLQSHHSSSDEEWFEFIECEDKNENVDETQNEAVFEVDSVENLKKVEDIVEISHKKDKRNKKRQKIDACCVIC